MKILNYFTSAVIYEDDAATIRETAENAVRAGVSLRGANLICANLIGAYLIGANLSRASLSDANLTGAYLIGASLVGVNLSGADLGGVSLSDANLTDANLSGVSLSDADLSGVSLSDADLSEIRADLFDVLAWAEPEIPALVAALTEGHVNGSVYRGKCACLVGTIANARGCDYKTLPHNASSPIERWFLAILKGAPVDHPVVAITLGWIAEYQGGAR